MSSELTAELRFWWRHEAPVEVAQWFAGLAPDSPEHRRDIYSPTGWPDWGIKQRGEHGPIESKMALAVSLPLCDLPNARMWLKQEVDWAQLPAGGAIHVHKARQLHQITDTAGKPRCEIELSRVRTGKGAEWTTLCFEAQADLSDPLRNLKLAWAAGRGLPGSLESGWCASYPEWLMRVAGPAAGEEP